MIRFKKIRFKNFYSFGNNFTEIDLEQAKTTIITGKNGAGKSACIIESLCFALYGKPHRKVNLGQLINSINNKDSVVEVEFSINNDNYKIVRGQKPKIFEIYINGKMINQDAALRDYQKYLEQNILKMNFKTFNQVVILSASNFIPFMQLSSYDRRNIMENLLDIEIFSRMNICLKNRMSLVNTSINNVNNELKLINQELLLKENYVEDLQENNSIKSKELEKEINEYKDFIKEHNKIYDDLFFKYNEDKNKFKTTFPKYEKNKKLLENEKYSLEYHKQSCSKELHFFEENDICPTCHQDIKEELKITKINELREKINEADNVIKSVEEKLNKTLEIYNKLINFDLANGERYQEVKKIEHNLVSYAEKIKALTNKHDFKDKIYELIEKHVSELQIVKVKLEEQNKIREGLLVELDNLNVVSSILKDDGIKAKVIKQYIPIVNKLINKFLHQMDFHILFEIDENFNETIKSRYRDTFTYNSFSQGQKLRIDLALLFSWRELTKLRNSLSTNLLILDEIMDASADAEGSAAFFKILKRLDAETKVFIISHRVENQLDSFNSIIEIDMKNNFSQITRTV